MTTARLHMGFLDLNGGLGRRFGSVGLSLEQPALTVTARHAREWTATGSNAERALRIAQDFAAKAGLAGAAALEVESQLREHAGLGSGTQLALAVGMALCRLRGRRIPLIELAALCGRGARSGIGIGAFAQGGLLLDGGRGAQTQVPPILARMEFPAEWRVLLVYDSAGAGVHGRQEVEAFRTLPDFPATVSGEICRRVLMQALPAVLERNLAAFGEAIHAVQCLLGDYFAKAQGGQRYTSVAVGSALEWLRSEGVTCIGQSSWGPTGFAVLESVAEAEVLRGALMARYADVPQLEFDISRARNRGSEIVEQYEAGRAVVR